jgi:hypothetical protein
MKTVSIILVVFLLVSCAGNPSATIIPAATVEKLANVCAKEQAFAERYPVLREQVIANREWLEELMPEVWKTLAEFDPVAKDIHEVVRLVCRFAAGEPVESLIEAKRIELQKRGIDWDTVLKVATKIADVVL